MAKLDRFMIEKAVLQALPEGELDILLGGGKILNELNMSTKYLMFGINAVRARAVSEQTGRIHATPILGGLHHHYVRI